MKTANQWRSKDEIVFLFQGFTSPVQDLTKINGFPNGAQSAEVGANAGDWEVFELQDYQGEGATLSQGENYPSLASMPLKASVKSFRPKQNWVVGDRFRSPWKNYSVNWFFKAT